MLGHKRHVGRIIGLSTVRHGREVRAVRFDQQAIQRHKSRHIAQVLGVLEGHNARQRDVVTHVQTGAGHGLGLGKAVKNAAGLGAGIGLAAFAQDGQRVFRTAAGMDHQRLLRDLRGLDMDTKALALPFQIGNRASALAVFHAVVVQPRLANGHHARQRSALDQVLYRWLGHIFGVGMHTHGGPEVVMVQRQLVHIGKLFHGGADAQRARDLGSSHGLADLSEVGTQLWKIQMAVGIGEHHEICNKSASD